MTNDFNSDRDVFVFDRQTGTTAPASVFAGGRPIRGINDGGTGTGIFVRDLSSGATARADKPATGDTFPDGTAPSISKDGTKVTWDSYDPYVAADTNGSGDVYVRDLNTGKTLAASSSASGTTGNSDSFDGSVSSNGSRVVFVSGASDLGVDPGDGRRHLFVRCLRACS